MVSGQTCGTLAFMREVEVKYRAHDAARLVDVFTCKGIQLSAQVEQDDQAYAPVGWDRGTSEIGIGFAGLRTRSVGTSSR